MTVVIPRLLTAPAVVLIVRPRDSQNAEVLAELLVERREEDPFDGRGGSQDRKLTLRYILVGGCHLSPHVRKGTFHASYDSGMKTVSLTSHTLYNGAVDLTLPGLEGNGIGTYLMNVIVSWAKQFSTDTMVNTITLLSVQAVGDNKERRNIFYEQFGIVFDYNDPTTRAAGKSRDMMTSALVPREKWSSNIVEQDVAEYVRERNLACKKAEERARLADEEVERLRRVLTEERIGMAKSCRKRVRQLAVRFILGAAVAGMAVAWVTSQAFF
ncbi:MULTISPECIES: hypothetical protein [Burkholderia]|uniref:hypothetical protein n=1 Tax=Burkholderia TaxID=32008 RepID=UPI00119BB064|nr:MULTISPECIES: hypothetical protein [Burkholderia]MDN7735265.1 hypothetical protein [Burkholderia gladioli]TWC60321.1 hypothetical protein FB600_1289 [Burkholderia sp. SJZ089]TWC94774.1 hypothetical protein FBX98_1279 [Burkholderia sp. SJZ115]TWC96870.1 hypothetical protein FB601_12810 [Burkholderia sp. SJZ091]